MPDGSTEFCTSNNNLRQIPDVKAGLEIKVATIFSDCSDAEQPHMGGDPPRRISELTGIPVWSHDGKWIVTSSRSLGAGEKLSLRETWRRP